MTTKTSTTTTIVLPQDLRDALRSAVDDQNVSVSALLRWGAMLVIERLGFELPESVANLRRAPFGGQAALGQHVSEPDFALLCFNEPTVYAALVRHAARYEGDIGRAAYEFMVAGIRREAELAVRRFN